MKIMHINQNYHYCGGTELYMLSIMDLLEERGNTQIIVFSNKNENTVKRKGRHEYHLAGVTSEFTRDHIGDLGDIIKDESPDIIYLHNVHNLFVVEECIRQKPTIRYIHDPSICCFTHWKLLPPLVDICNYSLGLSCFRNGCMKLNIKNFLRYIIRLREMRLHKKLKKIIVASHYMKKLLVQNAFDPANIEVISYFVNTPLLNTSRDFDKDKGMLFYAGIIHKIKGVDLMLKALSIVKNDFTVLIAGEGEYLEEYQCLVKELGLGQKVKFLGWVTNEDLMEYYRKSDIVIVPSFWVEAFGIVGIEAMSCSRPVIAFDTGGISEWLKDNVNGFLVSRGSYGELAEKIDLLLENRDLREQMGNTGRKLYEKNFTKEVHVNKLLSVMEGLTRR